MVAYGPETKSRSVRCPRKTLCWRRRMHGVPRTTGWSMDLSAERVDGVLCEMHQEATETCLGVYQIHNHGDDRERALVAGVGNQAT